MTDIEKKELNKNGGFLFHFSIDKWSLLCAMHLHARFGFLLAKKECMRNASHPIQSHSLAFHAS